MYVMMEKVAEMEDKEGLIQTENCKLFSQKKLEQLQQRPGAET